MPLRFSGVLLLQVIALGNKKTEAKVVLGAVAFNWVAVNVWYTSMLFTVISAEISGEKHCVGACLNGVAG